MPSFRKKYMKKYRKKTYAQYKAKKLARAKPFRSLVGTNRNTQIFNTKKTRQVHHFKDTFQYQTILGTETDGQPDVRNGLLQFDIGLTPKYATLKALYRQYRINSIKLIWTLKTIELTDNHRHPVVLMRYNYDPTLTVGDIGYAFLLRQSNVIKKQFIHNTPEGTTLEYIIKPCTMQALKQWNSGGFIPSPKFEQWCDFSASGTSETALYGLIYNLTDLYANQAIDFSIQFNYSCRDVI